MSAAETFLAPQSTAEWAERLHALAEQLRGLTSAKFFDEKTLRYHSCMKDFGRLVYAVTPVENTETYQSVFRDFLAAFPQTNGWLPERSDDLEAMPLSEVLFRLTTNSADERWVDGALVASFESGSLVAALATLARHSDRLFLAPR